MSKFNGKNQTGAASGQQVLIIAIITIVAALMIVAIFVILSKSKAPSAATEDFLKNINAQRENQNSKNNASAPTDDGQSKLSYAGVLTEIKTDFLVIIERESQNRITIFLTPETPITYNSQPFSRSKFYIGDQLQITAINLGDKLQAEAVTVAVSASPATAAPLPIIPNVRPDGTIKPLGSD